MVAVAVDVGRVVRTWCLFPNLLLGHSSCSGKVTYYSLKTDRLFGTTHKTEKCAFTCEVGEEILCKRLKGDYKFTAKTSANSTVPIPCMR